MLLNQAQESLEKAHAPYSNFKVGAAALLGNGQIFTGNNQENMAYPSGLCAERVALFYAKSQFPDSDIATLAITYLSPEKNEEAISPCGACRQVISEYELEQQKPIRILLWNGLEEGSEIIEIASSLQLLPLSFYHKALRNK